MTPRITVESWGEDEEEAQPLNARAEEKQIHMTYERLITGHQLLNVTWDKAHAIFVPAAWKDFIFFILPFKVASPSHSVMLCVCMTMSPSCVAC